MIKVFKRTKGEKAVISSYNQLLSTWDTEYVEKDIETSFGITHVIICGTKQNPPLMMFHGVGDNSAIMWALNMKALSKHFYCIAVDTLGGPGKSCPNTNYSKKTFNKTTWINEIIDALGLDKINIVGVSNGATMAFNYALKEPDRVNNIVCIEGGMVTNPIKSMMSAIGMMFPEILMPTQSNLKKIMQKMRSPYSDTFDHHPELVEHLLLLMKNHNQQAMFVHSFERYEKGMNIPNKDSFYFLLGDYRIDANKEFTDILDDDGFRYKVIKNAGHGLNHEQPEAANREIIDFILE